MTALVLTGNIVPDTSNTAITDPEQRALEYARAIRFYKEEGPYPVYFVENSNYDIEGDPNLGPLLDSDRFHVHRVSSKGCPERGKGYEEFRILDSMVEKLHEEGYQRLIKVTGRYIVRNFRSEIPKRTDRAYIDLHPRIKSGVAITAFFVCPVPYYLEHLQGLYKEVNEAERITIEKCVFQRLDGLGREAPRLLPREPIFEGISGTSGYPIGRNPYRRAARNIYRQLLRMSGYKRIPREL